MPFKVYDCFIEDYLVGLPLIDSNRKTNDLVVPAKSSSLLNKQ